MKLNVAVSFSFNYHQSGKRWGSNNQMRRSLLVMWCGSHFPQN